MSRHNKDSVTAPIDLSTIDDALPAGVRARIWSAFGAIPGVNVTSVSSVEVATGYAELSVVVRCWSPSLHAVQGSFTATLNSIGDEEAVAEEFLRELRMFYGEQLLRSQDGARHGLLEPMSTAHSHPLETRHLLIDRSLAPLAAAMGEDIIGSLPLAIRTLHNGSGDYIGGPVLAVGDVAVAYGPRGPHVLADVTIDSTPGKWVQWNGMTLTIAGREIPQTICVQAVGRPLGEVVDVHPVLADRVVADVRTIRDRQNHPMLQMQFETDFIPFDRMADEVAFRQEM